MSANLGNVPNFLKTKLWSDYGKKKKYVTKNKRIKILQQEVEQLKQQITRLTLQLDAANEQILADNPKLANSLEKDWFKDSQTEERKPGKKRKRKLPILPDARIVKADGLVLTRDSEGRLVYREKEDASPTP